MIGVEETSVHFGEVTPLLTISSFIFEMFDEMFISGQMREEASNEIARIEIKVRNPNIIFFFAFLKQKLEKYLIFEKKMSSRIRPMINNIFFLFYHKKKVFCELQYFGSQR